MSKWIRTETSKLIFYYSAGIYVENNMKDHFILIFPEIFSGVPSQEFNVFFSKCESRLIMIFQYQIRLEWVVLQFLAGSKLSKAPIIVMFFLNEAQLLNFMNLSRVFLWKISNSNHHLIIGEYVTTRFHEKNSFHSQTSN